MIRKARPDDLSRVAEILVFVKRIKFRPIFQDDDYSFGELQVLLVAKQYAELLDRIWVYDDKGIVSVYQFCGFFLPCSLPCLILSLCLFGERRLSPPGKWKKRGHFLNRTGTKAHKKIRCPKAAYEKQ